MKKVIEATEALIADLLDHDERCAPDCDLISYNTKYLSEQLDQIADETL